MIIIKKKGEIIRFGFFLVLIALLAYFVLNRVELFQATNGTPAAGQGPGSAAAGAAASKGATAGVAAAPKARAAGQVATAPAPAAGPVTAGAKGAPATAAPSPVAQPAPDGQDYFAEQRLERDQDRSLREEQLTAMINNLNVDADTRKSASEELRVTMKYASLENMAEALIRGKGVDDVLVKITDNSAMVSVKAKDHSEQQALQVADMVSSITGLRATAVKVRFQD